MALSEEWRHRIDRWQKALWESCYRPLGTVELCGFITTAQLTDEQAMAGSFTPMPAGTPWGAKWEYAWFTGACTLPLAAEGKRIVLRLDPGSESLVWINGKITGTVDFAHKEILLSKNASPGEQFEILLESYAGHGKRSSGEGPVPFGTVHIPEPPPAQATVGASTFGVWREELYQLAIDFTTLFELRKGLDPLSLRLADVDQALMDATLVVDLEIPEAEMLATVRTARARLKPVLDCKNGSTAPTLFAFGHAHIDVAWLWPLQETERKMARTASNQLSLMEQYPEYRFLQSQPHLYRMLKNDYPELYERFKTAVKSGQVIADGGMWVEPDTNISGGESLIRQILYGKQFFKGEFDIDSEILWLPDVFGYSGALPQILASCGIKGFATHKITWTYGGGDPFPYNTFWWEGIDGSAIPAHIFTEYSAHTRPSFLFDRWNIRLQKNGIRSTLLPFGYGDGGGGANRDHLEYLRRETDLEGLPRTKMSSPAEFFADLQQQGLPKERYVGELYFQAHRGTYTSQARTKLGNRKSEFALREAELWATAARALAAYTFTPRSLNQQWTAVLLNQFHDILPGSSIHRVYEEAEAAYAQVLTQTNAAISSAAQALTQPKAESVTIFNSLSWPRQGVLEINGKAVEVTLPSCGWTTLLTSEIAQPNPIQNGVTATPSSLENEHLHAVFNERGELVSLFDKDSARELLAAPANVFHLYKDVPDNWDAWDINSMTESVPVEINEPVELTLLQNHPLIGKLRLRRKLHHSTLEQTILLRKGSRRLEFETLVEWQESHKLLKVSFPVDIHANEAIHEIQFGHLRRPNHRSRPYDADRFEVCNYKWSALAEENRGVAILNDCKYGLSVTGNSLNLTLLKAGMAPDPVADRGEQRFTYAIYAWNGSLMESNVVRQAYELNVSPFVLAGAAGEGSIFNLDAPNVILETVKPAEDGSPDIILRLYECKHTATRCMLSTSLPVKSVTECNMVEHYQKDLIVGADKILLEFRPFEIKTLRLKMK